MHRAQGCIIVSGGTRGLGLQLVTRCVRRGWPVATFGRSPSPQLLELQEQTGERVYFQTLDLADPKGLSEFVDRAESFGGGIHGLINNAAIGQDHLLAQLPEEEIDRLIEVNLAGPIRLTRLVVRHLLRANRPGRILNISSICAQRGFAGLSVYSATKAGLEAFTRSLARELGPRQILVNAIAPGFFASEMSKSLASEQLKRIQGRTPIGRLIETEDLEPLLDLLMFESSVITGQIITIDGGASV